MSRMGRTRAAATAETYKIPYEDLQIRAIVTGMNALRSPTGGISDRRFVSDKKAAHPLFDVFTKGALLTSIASLALLIPMHMYGQDASSVGESRLACAQGLGQQAVARVRVMGVQMGLADVCVAALKLTATSGKLLDIYGSETGPGSARLVLNRLVDSAQLSTGPFRSSGSPLEMWEKGELTPSLAFDAGFTQSFVDKAKAPPASANLAELKRQTEGCLSLTLSLAACVSAGRVHGALAYQISNAFSNNDSRPAPKSDSQGPDRTQTSTAIDRKFQNWSQSWRMDRYRPGSIQLTSIDCSDQCKASGRFSFDRFGAVHTIDFVAFLSAGANGQYSVGRLCYNDNTTNMLDCTN
jgi:hypothetical protein